MKWRLRRKNVCVHAAYVRYNLIIFKYIIIIIIIKYQLKRCKRDTERKEGKGMRRRQSTTEYKKMSIYLIILASSDYIF